MVGLVVVSHSAQLAAGVVELAREMAGDVRLEAAGGMEDGALGTDAVRVMAAVEAADDGAGVLVLMDLGSAVLSAETALDLLDPEVAERVRLSAAPLIEGAVAAAVAAQSGASLDDVAREASGGLAGKAAHLGEAAETAGPERPKPDAREVTGPPDPQLPSHETGVVEERFAVTVAQGLHARPAARFVRTAAAHDATIEVTNATTGVGPASARSLNALATLGVREGHEIRVRASGPAAREAIDALRAVAGGGAAGGAGAAARGAGAAGGEADTAASGAATEPSTPPADASLDAALDTGAQATDDRSALDTGAQATDKRSAPDGATPLQGLPASPGIAIAPVRRLGGTHVAQLAPEAIDPDPAGTPQEEWAALGRARDAVRTEIEQRRAQLAAQVGEEEAEILDALGLIVDDEALLDPARHAIERDGVSAARAWADAVEAIAVRYRALEDAYQRERATDLEDVGRRVLAALASEDPAPTDSTAADPSDAPTILLTAELTPIDAAGLDPQQVAGIATARGGPTSHGAIVARALGVPAVVGLGDALLDLPDRDGPAILDGAAGLLIPDPDADTRTQYEARAAAESEAAAQAATQAHEPAVTRDGTAVEVAANAGDPSDAHQAVAHGADGIGLLRTELAFLHRDTEPTEDEQAEVYGAVAAALQGRPLVIRTLDAGADKPLPYLRMPAEENPFLGVRGVRLGLARPELLRTQLRAIARTAAVHANVKVMFPMVATIDELRAARALLDEALAATPRPPRDGFEVGVMIEVPAAALTAEQLAREVDFFSIGTNDLTQYTLAAERGNAAVAQLADGLHPAVLKLIGAVCDAARAHGRWVGVCGELGADPAAAALLVGLGVRELSVAAPSVPAVKAAVRALDTAAARQLAQAAVAAESAAAVRALVVSEA